MNKKLVAVAIAGLLAAPLVQAQTANVTLYGRLNMDMEIVNGQRPDGTNPNIYRVSSNSSRFGLRGTEGLGGGLNAIFQVETALSTDTGTGTLAGRDSFVGLSGTWGQFTVGRFLGALYDTLDLWGNNSTLLTSILATYSLSMQGGQTRQTGSFADRISNSVRYETPVMSGFRGKIQYGAGGPNNEGTPKTNAGVTSGAAFYNNGPLKMGAGFEMNNSFRAAGLNDLAWSVAGGWQFPNVYVGGIYEKLDYDVQVNATTKGNLTRDLWGIGATVNLGPGELYAEWARAQDGKGSAPNGTRVGGLARGPDTSANQWEVSYTYPLSNRTKVQAGYIKIDNSKNASYIFGVNGFASAIGGKPGGFMLGMFHNF